VPADKRKGAAFETGILKWFRSKGVNAERLRLAGKDDEGDVVCIVAGRPYVFELKATVKMDLPQFWREATTEAFNYAKAPQPRYCATSLRHCEEAYGRAGPVMGYLRFKPMVKSAR
jgi:hypothetical protein